jgi:hypothetical protein
MVAMSLDPMFACQEVRGSGEDENLAVKRGAAGDAYLKWDQTGTGGLDGDGDLTRGYRGWEGIGESALTDGGGLRLREDALGVELTR